MERATKLLLMGWACAALAVATWLTPGWPSLSWLTAAAFFVSGVSTLVDRRAVAPVLACTYVFPAFIRIAHGPYHVAYDVVWIGALLGAISPDALRTPWHIPSRWRSGLVCWALVVAVGATVVAFREADFNGRLLTDSRMASESWGGVPRFTIAWVLHVALNLVVGILWFDWLFGANFDFRRVVVTPLLLGCVAMAGVAAYQAVFDLSFLNQTVFGAQRRASGTVFDANVCGMLAALWSGGAILWAASLRSWRVPAAILTLSVMWAAVWASSSRTAFIAAALILLFSLPVISAWLKAARRRVGIREGLAVGALAALLVAVTFSSLRVSGPLIRLANTLPEPTVDSVRRFAVELWNRDNYGPAAVAMIRDSPWWGVGVGSFHFLVADYAPTGTPPPDNAQNWYRHQLAELGLFGSAGWIFWLVSFCGLLTRLPASAQPETWTVRGIFLAFASISLVAMPGQSVLISTTFWTLAFWAAALIGVPPAGPPRKWAGVATLAVVGVYLAGTLNLSLSHLRPPVRAQRIGRPYSYGFYYPERAPDGGEQRWARRRGAMLVPAENRQIELTVSVNHFDIGTNPVDVRVWCDGVRVMNRRLTDSTPVTALVPLSGERKDALVETWVSRVVRPADVGGADDRELGLLVRWTFPETQRQER